MSAPSVARCTWSTVTALIVALAMMALPAPATVAAQAQSNTGTYTNPLPIQIPGDGLMQSCPDPSIIRTMDSPTHATWYAYCTGDPLSDQDRDANGNYRFHKMPIVSSTDLAHWTYRGDVFSDPRTGNAAPPPYAASNSGYFAPDIRYFNNRYYVYFAVTVTTFPGDGSAVGVATSRSPTGPWTAAATPVIPPEDAPCCPGQKRWLFDPAVVSDNTGQKYIFFGSYFGGIAARKLSNDGFTAPPPSVQITIDNRYEAPYIWKRAGYYYLFASATNCCNGPLTGYSVFAGRSRTVLGPYVDREGRSLLDSHVGGTPAISMNGNRWVGPGHNAIFTDFSGQDYMLYHAVDRFHPYFAPAPGFSGNNVLTKRPLLEDPLDWDSAGWPTVRGGYWASDRPQPAPAAQPGERNRYRASFAPWDQHGSLLPYWSDDFNGTALNRKWTWVRPPAPGTYSVGAGQFRFDTQSADLYEDSNNASVLTEREPVFNYMVEAKVKLDYPRDGCCFNYVQAGLVIYGDDDDFIKLADVSIWDTRQTEFAKEMKTFPRYGNTVVGPPGSPDNYTYLRIVVRRVNGSEKTYRAYTSDDGVHWVRGGVWTHNLGNYARIGLVSMGGSGFHALFDYVHVYPVLGPPTEGR